jgi:hypothetical protein
MAHSFDTIIKQLSMSCYHILRIFKELTPAIEMFDKGGEMKTYLLCYEQAQGQVIEIIR